MPVEHIGSDLLDVFKTGVLPDGASAGEAELGAVVLSGVVRSGEHRPGRIELAGREVDQIGRGQAEVDDVDTLLEYTADEGLGQFGTGRAHVAADQNPRRVGETGETDP